MEAENHIAIVDFITRIPFSDLEYDVRKNTQGTYDMREIVHATDGTCEILAAYGWGRKSSFTRGGTEATGGGIIVRKDGRLLPAVLSRRTNGTYVAIADRNGFLDDSTETQQTIFDLVFNLREGDGKTVKINGSNYEVERYPHPTEKSKVVAPMT